MQLQVDYWYNSESDKIKLQSKTDEVNQSEKVRIYHQEIHRKVIKKSSILKLKTNSVTLEGHSACAEFLEDSVASLLLHPATLDKQAQEMLLKEVVPVLQKLITRCLLNCLPRKKSKKL